MLFLDAPDHQRLRNLVSRSFTPRRAEEWRPLVREVTKELLDEVDRRAEPEFDLMEALAAPLPAIAIARILGVDPAQREDFKAWSEAASASFFNPFASEAEQEAGMAGYASLEACFRSEIAKRRDTPARRRCRGSPSCRCGCRRVVTDWKSCRCMIWIVPWH